MSSEELKFEVDHSVTIRKPAAEVFAAISSPKHLNRYFTSHAEGQLEKGQEVKWRWLGYEKTVLVDVIESTPPTRLVFQWNSHDEKYKTTVQFDLTDQNEKGTMVRVREGKWVTSQAGLENSYDNSGGWMHMLCCLKAYMEFGIDLRSNPIPENWK